MRACTLGLFAAAVASVVAGKSSADSFSLNQPIYAEDSANPRKPLMALLDKGGVAKPLEDAGINVYGLVESSYTYNLSDNGNFIAGRSFDYKNQDIRLNQAILAVEKATDYKKAWDLGGKMVWTYGADAILIHSNGLFDKETPENQIDLTEAYGEIVIPLGNGLKTKFGKFITPLGFEYVNPSLNAFYSHSFLFGIVPYSHTGVFSSYALNDAWTISAGLNRGWEQSIDDNNDCLSFLGSIGYTKDKMTAAFNFTIGPETPDNGDYRYAFDFWLTYSLADQWSVSLNADYIYEEDGASDGGTSNVYGVAGYVAYTLNDYFVLNGRVEWFNDTQRAAGFDSVLYEVTVGATITPFARNEIGRNFKIRPEIRADFADNDIFADGEDSSQVTFGIDGYFTF